MSVSVCPAFTVIDSVSAREYRGLLHPGLRRAIGNTAYPNPDEQLVPMPGVLWASSPLSKPLGKRRPKLETPLTHGSITDDNAAFGQQLLDLTEAHTEL